jgi:hypothetical protein
VSKPEWRDTSRYLWPEETSRSFCIVVSQNEWKGFELKGKRNSFQNHREMMYWGYGHNMTYNTMVLLD